MRAPQVECATSWRQAPSRMVRSLVAVEADSGWLRLVGHLDRESVPELGFSVRALDGGDPVRSATADVHLRVLDMNDNAPRLELLGMASHLASPSVSENRFPGAVAAVLSVRDEDAGANGTVTCHLLASSSSRMFRLQSFSTRLLQLLTVAALDRELSDSHAATIRCVDGGGLKSEASFAVQVLDENDNAPVFNAIGLSSPNGTILLRQTETPSTNLSAMDAAVLANLSATDADMGDNDRVDYRLLDGAEDGDFAIDTVTGLLRATKPLDRERRSRARLRVVASDQGRPRRLSTTATVELEVRAFLNFAYYGHQRRGATDAKNAGVRVAENSAPGLAVGQVPWTDPDDGPGGEVQFALSDEPSSNVGEGAAQSFQVSMEGVIRTSRSLDREAQADYAFWLVATDNGLPTRLSSSAAVFVRVLDVNDCSPVFQFPRPSAGHGSHAVAVGDAPGHIVLQAAARCDPFALLKFKADNTS
uniref:Cadherin domain-containing protein n=1 Tax=Macrostomum lignano TaxID=282301 RepID=A0A1I8GX97_9PLAT